MKTLKCTVLHLLVFVQIIRTQAKVASIIVFGDSTVDSGNNNHISTILRSDFGPYGRDFINGQPTGRFSNGRIVTDFISEGFQLKPVIPAYLDSSYGIADFATGVCFASAGTGYDDATSNVLSVMPLQRELQYYKEYQTRLREYLGNEKAEKIIAESLYLISMGTNDFLENYYILPYRSSQYSVEGYQQLLTGIARKLIQDLYNLGARKISLGGVPPMGCLPLERARRILYGSDCIEEYNNVARNFNSKLQDLVNNLSKELPGIQVVFSNPYDMLLKIIKDPHSYGFESTAKACCASGRFEMGYLCNSYSTLTCQDADKYVFWDSFHPTQKTNSILAQNAINNSLAVFL
ncbi:hypothetical protein ACET3Z_017898 [Daucus carota]